MIRKCKRCEHIEYGIWGYLGLLGYSMIVVAFGYAFSRVYFAESVPFVLIVFGVILWLPMFFISLHENKEDEK